MKTLWLSIFVSLGIQALVMSLETGWLKNSAPTTPHPDIITISLETLAPKRIQRAETLAKSPPVSEKKAGLSEKSKARPPKPVITRTPPKPAVDINRSSRITVSKQELIDEMTTGYADLMKVPDIGHASR